MRWIWLGALFLGLFTYVFINLEWRIFLLELDAKEFHTHTKRIRLLERDEQERQRIEAGFEK